MRTVLYLLLTTTLWTPVGAQGPGSQVDDRAADRPAVRAAIVDYVQAIYEANPDRVTRSVHPRLAKVGFYPAGEEGEFAADTMSYEELLETARTYRRDRDLSRSPRRIDILHVHDRIAAARLIARWGVDYFHLVKIDGAWKIAHVVWQAHDETTLAEARADMAARGAGLSVDTALNLPYAADPHPEQHFDLYWPDRDRPAATVLFIHGGSLQESGERRDSPAYARVCEPFVIQGYACATTDYRLAPGHQWPTMPQDVAAAIAELRRQVRDRGGDPDEIVLFGHSSGCHLVAAVSTNPRYLATVGLAPGDLAGSIPMGCTLDRYDTALRRATADDIRAGFQRDESSVATYGTAEEWIQANPAHFVGDHVPPTLVVLAEAERFFPSILEQAARYTRLLQEADVPAELVVVPGRHMSIIQALHEPDDPTFAVIHTFLREYTKTP